MSLLIGPSFLRRPVFTQTKRITLDLPADKAFGEMMGNWRINPDEEEWTAGPLFERAVGVSFGVAWTRSMYSESKATLSNSARNLARLADPTTICFRYATELSPTPTVGSRPNRLTSILKELWPRLSSVNYHGRLDELTFPHVSDPDHLYIAHVFYVQGDEPWFKTIDEFLRARLVGGSAAVDPIMPDAIRTLYTLSARGFRAASGGDGTKRLSFHTAEPEAKTAAETTAVAKPEKDVGEVSGASSKEGKEISRISACAACGGELLLAYDKSKADYISVLSFLHQPLSTLNVSRGQVLE